MLKKEIRAFGQLVIMACDSKCNKAWGSSARPRHFFEHSNKVVNSGDDLSDVKDLDDYELLADHELAEAPADPGTYEGGEGKPSTTSSENMNKWCFRECERSVTWYKGAKEKALPSFTHRVPNFADRCPTL